MMTMMPMQMRLTQMNMRKKTRKRSKTLLLLG